MTNKTKEIWIVKGRVTCTDAHSTAKLGAVEWQFSDGPPGKRGSSADYTDLEEGLRDHSGAVFHFVPEARYYVCQRGGTHRIYDEGKDEWVAGVFDADERAAAQRYADLLNAEDERPLPNEVKISADAADHTGRVLDALLAADTGLTLHATTDTYFWQSPNRYLIRTAADALLALGNDTDAIVTE